MKIRCPLSLLLALVLVLTGAGLRWLALRSANPPFPINPSPDNDPA